MIKVSVIGAGTMGTGIAQIAATNGHEVCLYDSFDGAIESAENKLNKILNRLVEKEKISEEQKDTILAKINFTKDLDIYPSPYLAGEFEYLLPEGKDHNYQIIIETNRGCPFLCTYCYWGKGGNTTKYKFHSLDRIFAEIDWVAKKKIEYLFNADSNFGMHRRDAKIAKDLVKSKQIEWYWIKGHSNDPMNDLVDELAKKATPI